MKIEKLPRYNRDVKKILKAHKLSLKIIEDTENLFLENPQDPSLRYHKINCKKDKNRYSITIINTQYRILLTDLGEKITFNTLLNHNSYDRINKDC